MNRERGALDAATLRARLHDRRAEAGGAGETPWWPILVEEVLDSTQDRLAELEAGGAPGGTVVIATAQRSGRGRRGRSWHSPAGAGLYLSALLRPGGPGWPWGPGGPGHLARDAVCWSMVAAVAACEAVREFGARAEIKWPNDVLAGGRKIGGLLVETRTEGETLRAVLVGCGLNLAHAAEDFPEAFRDEATSLALATGRAPAAAEIAVALLARLEAESRLLTSDGPEAVRARWLERSPASTGFPVVVLETDRRWEGTTRGLGEDGALAVEDGEGRLRWLRLGEEIRVRPAPRREALPAPAQPGKDTPCCS